MAAFALKRRHRDEVRRPDMVLDQPLDDATRARLIDIEHYDRPGVIRDGPRACS